jgi:hypothetical protein
MTPRATRVAVFVFAMAAVLGRPVTARSVDTAKPDLDASINHSAPARPAAAKPAAATAARPAQNAARPAAARPAAARPNAARPEAAHNGAHSTAAHPTAAHEARHEAAGRDHHGAGEHAARGDHAAGEHGHSAARNAAYSHGENLHGGHRIPEARFRGSFGHEHQFHIGHPVMIGGQASFQFGGFWFGIVDPWPAAWLYTDAVYVDFVEEEYVLVNVAHPEVTIAVSAGDAAPTTCTAEAAVPVAPVVSAPVVAAPVIAVAVPYPYLTWHYWRHFWR